MLEGLTDIKKSFPSGNTRKVTFQIIDKDTGAGFLPSTLTMTIYDVSATGLGAVDTIYRVHGSLTGPTVSSAIVNEQNGVDVIGMCDASGNVEIYLTPEDTTVGVPAIQEYTPFARCVSFTWTWGSPAKVSTHDIVIRIRPNRATVAV